MLKKIKNPLLILGAAAILLLASSVGATRAAMVYTTERESVSFSTAEIAVALLENGQVVEDNDGKMALTYGLKDGEAFKIGKTYDEVLSIANTSSEEYGYEEYVRVIITKSWFDDKTNAKDTSLDPELIKLNVLNDGWILDEKASTSEQSVYYLNQPLGQGKEVRLTDMLTISSAVNEKVTKSFENGLSTSGNIETTYDYDGKSFYIEVEVDGVQTHHAKDAIKGAWGVDVNIAEDGSLSLVRGE